jgi:uncharacterized membrane protein
MQELSYHLRAHPRLFGSTAVGVIVGLLPLHHSAVLRGLIGWNAGVWVYLVSIAVMMVAADHGHVRRGAARQAESATAVLAIVTAGAVASIGAVVFELAAIKSGAAGGGVAGPRWPHITFALFTVAGSWLLVPTLFALSYASTYYGTEPGGGLRFPSDEPQFEPDYVDFLYYSFTIAVAAQTADVGTSTRAMRRLTLMQSLLAFAFNTAVLAFSINLAASVF